MAAGTVTIEDVAAHAGVSLATASRALRDLPHVAPTTRARVAESARLLGFHPDPHASRLVTGRTATIGMAVPLLTSWYYAQLVAGWRPCSSPPATTCCSTRSAARTPADGSCPRPSPSASASTA